MLTPKFDEALLLATKLHATQIRKGSDIPYIAHPLSVACLVLEAADRTPYASSREEMAIAALFHEESAHTPNGRLAVTRAGSARTHSTKQYDYQALCADLSNKRFVPLLTRIKARSLREFPALLQHEGEEFIYVLAGQITVHTDFYQPILLNRGDACYFDSTMGHACVAGEEDAQVLWVSSHSTQNT